MRTLFFLHCVGCVTTPAVDSDLVAETSETDLPIHDSECDAEGEACTVSEEYPAPNGTCCNSRHTCWPEGCHY